jgi:hypothetical protein
VAQASLDSHVTTVTRGKIVAQRSFDTHAKTGTHGTPKKSEPPQKSKIKKKTENDKSDPKVDDNTGIVILFSIKYYFIS